MQARGFGRSGRVLIPSHEPTEISVATLRDFLTFSWIAAQFASGEGFALDSGKSIQERLIAERGCGFANDCDVERDRDPCQFLCSHECEHGTHKWVRHGYDSMPICVRR